MFCFNTGIQVIIIIIHLLNAYRYLKFSAIIKKGLETLTQFASSTRTSGVMTYEDKQESTKGN